MGYYNYFLVVFMYIITFEVRQGPILSPSLDAEKAKQELLCPTSPALLCPRTGWFNLKSCFYIHKWITLQGLWLLLQSWKIIQSILVWFGLPTTLSFKLSTVCLPLHIHCFPNSKTHFSWKSYPQNFIFVEMPAVENGGWWVPEVLCLSCLPVSVSE